MHQARRGHAADRGGVGVTPIRALLEESTGPTSCSTGCNTGPTRCCCAELQELAADSAGAQLHVLAGRTGAGQPAEHPVRARSSSARWCPTSPSRDVYVCGPPPMTDAVLRSLRALKVPRAQIHAERFSLA